MIVKNFTDLVYLTASILFLTILTLFFIFLFYSTKPMILPQTSSKTLFIALEYFSLTIGSYWLRCLHFFRAKVRVISFYSLVMIYLSYINKKLLLAIWQLPALVSMNPHPILKLDRNSFSPLGDITQMILYPLRSIK